MKIQVQITLADGTITDWLGKHFQGEIQIDDLGSLRAEEGVVGRKVALPVNGWTQVVITNLEGKTDDAA